MRALRNVLMLLRFVAKVLLVLAGAALLTALCLFSLAGFVVTIPYRKNPSNAAQLRAAVNFAMALSVLVATLRRDRGDAVEQG